jgi:hypothetical protein
MFKKTIIFIAIASPAYAQVDPATIAGMDAARQAQYYQHDDAVGMEAAGEQQAFDNYEATIREQQMQKRIDAQQEQIWQMQEQMTSQREHDFIINSLNH